MNVFDMLAQIQDPAQREALVTQMAQNYDLPETAFAPAQTQMPPAQPEAPTTPPIAQGQPRQQGPFTSAPGSQPPMAQGMPGTQSGPAVPNPEEQKGDMEAQLAAILSQGGGMLPGMEPPPMNTPPPVSGGPSLGSAGSPQGFAMQSAQGNPMMGLAQLLGGQ